MNSKSPIMKIFQAPPNSHFTNCILTLYGKGKTKSSKILGKKKHEGGKGALQVCIYNYNAFVVKTRFSTRAQYSDAQKREIRKSPSKCGNNIRRRQNCRPA